MVTLGSLKQIITEMPKTELHLHLEGAIPVETLYNLFQNRGGAPSITSIKDLKKSNVYRFFTFYSDMVLEKHIHSRRKRF